MTLTKRQKLILAIAWFGWIFDIADTALFNLAKVPMLTQMLGAEYQKRGPQVEGAIQAVFLVGWSLGGLFFGVLADKWGRTRTLVVTVLLYCACTGLTALCRTPEQVAAARFLTALGIGGEWAAGAALVAEAFSDQLRPLASSLLQSAAAFGPMIAAGANYLLRGQPWQWLFLVGILPALICTVIRSEVHDPKKIVKQKKSPLSELFGEAVWRNRVLAAMVIGAVGIAGAGTATFWQPNLVKLASVGMSKAVVDSRTSELTVCGHIGTLLGVFVIPWACQRFGRRPTIAVCYALAPAIAFLALRQDPDFNRLLLLFPAINFFAIGVSAAFVLYFPELFPMQIRATGAGMAYNVGRLLAIPMPLITGWLSVRLNGSIATAVVLSGGVYLIGLLALPFAPETKGKPLPGALT